MVCHFRTDTGVGKCSVNGWGLESSAIGDGEVLQTQKISDPFAFCNCKTTKFGFNNNSPWWRIEHPDGIPKRSNTEKPHNNNIPNKIIK